MDPIIDPVRVKPAKLEELIDEVPAEGPALPDFSTPWPFDSVALAATVIRHNRDDAAQRLEAQLARGFSQHPDCSAKYTGCAPDGEAGPPRR